jgi:CheY-like chemotaxis protein
MKASSFKLAEHREKNKSLHLLPIQVRKSSAAPEEKVAWLIDDSPFNLLALEMLLKPYKISCVQFSDPNHALNTFKDMHDIDDKILIIFTDIEMPFLDGFELMKEFHKILRSRQQFVPIVACTGNAGDDYCETLIKAGFDDYLVKPVQSQILEKILMTLTKRTKN